MSDGRLSDMSEQNLKSSAVNGAIWTGVEKFSRQAVQFVIGIILARLLPPEDFGVIGMLAIFIAIAQTFTDSGLSSALIQKKNRTEVDCSTIFFFSTGVGVLFYLLLYAAAPLIADFYNMPILTDVTRVVALSIILSGLTAVQNARLTIELRFRTLSLIAIISMVVTGVTGLALAYSGWGVWALVFQALAGQIVTSICTWYCSRWMPILTFSKDSFKQLWGFGSKLLVSGLINTLYDNLYTLVIGKRFTSAEVAFYNRGNHFALLPAQTVQDMAIKVNYPILAKMQDDDERLLRAYKKLLTVPLYILYPVLVGMAVAAEPLVIVLIGEKWLPCVPIMQVLCIGYMFFPLTHINLNLLYVKGRTDLVLKLEFIKKSIAFLILFATMPFGIIVMVIGRAIYCFIAFSFNCYYTGKILNYGEWKQLKLLLPIFINCVIMAAAVYASMLPFELPIVKLCIGIPVGIISYLLFSIVTKDAAYGEVLEIVRRKLLRKYEG